MFFLKKIRIGFGTHLDLGDALIITIAEERMRMRRLLLFCSYNDSCPSKFLYSDESLVNVRVLGNEESPKMKGEFLWVENMRGSFGEDCRLSLTAGRSKIDEMHPQYVIFLTAKKKTTISKVG